jgi:hypothetical protein
MHKCITFVFITSATLILRNLPIDVILFLFVFPRYDEFLFYLPSIFFVSVTLWRFRPIQNITLRISDVSTFTEYKLYFNNCCQAFLIVPVALPFKICSTTNVSQQHTPAEQHGHARITNYSELIRSSVPRYITKVRHDRLYDPRIIIIIIIIIIILKITPWP